MQTGVRVESILEVEEDEDINVIVQTGVRVESILELEEDEEDTSSSVRSQGNTFILLQ